MIICTQSCVRQARTEVAQRHTIISETGSINLKGNRYMEYKTKLDRVMHYVDRKTNFGQTVSVVNAKRAVNYAYSAGRQSVIDDACILKWKEVGLYGLYAAYEKVCRVETPLGDYSITYWVAQKEFTMYDENGDATRSFKSLEKAKQYASNLHRERLKKAFGI